MIEGLVFFPYTASHRTVIAFLLLTHASIFVPMEHVGVGISTEGEWHRGLFIASKTLKVTQRRSQQELSCPSSYRNLEATRLGKFKP